MRSIKLLSSLLLIWCSADAQTIPAFTTDEQCEKFIRTRIRGMEQFLFDTIQLSPEELAPPNPQFRKWQRVDINNDKKPDLIFAGRNPVQGWGSQYTLQAYVSRNTGYELTALHLRQYYPFKPDFFVRKINNEQVIIIQPYEYYRLHEPGKRLTKVLAGDCIICVGNDSLIWKYNTILNYRSKPSGVTFDSLIVVKDLHTNGFDSIIIYRDGSGRFFTGRKLELMQSFQESPDDVKYLQDLVSRIDIQNTLRKAIFGGMHSGSQTIYIYHNGGMDKFYEVGAVYLFTFKAIYDYFHDLKQDLDFRATQ